MAKTAKTKGYEVSIDKSGITILGQDGSQTYYSRKSMGDHFYDIRHAKKNQTRADVDEAVVAFLKTLPKQDSAPVANSAEKKMDIPCAGISAEQANEIYNELKCAFERKKWDIAREIKPDYLKDPKFSQEQQAEYKARLSDIANAVTPHYEKLATFFKPKGGDVQFQDMQSAAIALNKALVENGVRPLTSNSFKYALNANPYYFDGNWDQKEYREKRSIVEAGGNRLFLDTLPRHQYLWALADSYAGQIIESDAYNQVNFRTEALRDALVKYEGHLKSKTTYEESSRNGDLAFAARNLDYELKALGYKGVEEAYFGSRGLVSITDAKNLDKVVEQINQTGTQLISDLSDPELPLVTALNTQEIKRIA